MKRFTFWVTALLALLLATPASSTTSWNKCNGSGNPSAQGALRPGQVACNDPIIGDLRSQILDVSACTATATAIYNADTTGTALTTTVEIWTCVTPVCSPATCVPIEGFVLDGVAESAEIYAFDAKWICVDGTTDPLAGDTPRVLIHCN